MFTQGFAPHPVVVRQLFEIIADFGEDILNLVSFSASALPAGEPRSGGGGVQPQPLLGGFSKFYWILAQEFSFISSGNESWILAQEFWILAQEFWFISSGILVY